MEKNIEIRDQWNPTIRKVEKLEQDKYALHFDFLSIPVKVNKSYLDTIIKDINQDNPMKGTA